MRKRGARERASLRLRIPTVESRRVAFSVKCAVCRVCVRCGMLLIYLEPFDPHKQLYGRCLCALVHALLNSPSSESRLVSRKGKRSPVASSSGNGAG